MATAQEHATRYRYVSYLWDDAAASRLDGVGMLVYRSNLLGSDGRITNTGGGNTSSKLVERDPLTGEAVQVLWVKGSGGDLRTAGREHFASLELSKLHALQELYAKSPQRGVKSASEDEMVRLYAHCTFNLNPRASSIDTPLHAFIPFQHVDHTHPNSVIAVAATRRSRELTQEIFGDEVAWTPWLRPGFELGLALQDIWRKQPGVRGVVLGQHGLINGADDPRACYELSLDLIEKAARFIEARDKGAQTFGGARFGPTSDTWRDELVRQIVPWLRGQLSANQRVIGTVQCDANMLRFVNSVDAPRLAELGTSCPDHFLRTKIKPLYVDWNPESGILAELREKLLASLDQYRRDYAAYYQRCRRPDSPAMRDANPTVILIPGLGMIAWGKTKSESRVTAEFYKCAVEVMRGAEAIDEYIALDEQEAFDIEYWLLEEAKLRRMPPEKPLARRIVLVVGAGSGIGRITAERLAAQGAHVVCADMNLSAAEATARQLIDQCGEGIGVAGSGISACGPAIAVALDVTDRASIRAALLKTLWAYGGLDHVVVTAGLYVSPDTQGSIPDTRWADTFDVNVTGVFLVADEAKTIWDAQGLPGSMVVTTSANAIVSKRGSLAYDTSKAAANHLVRELAIELAPRIRVNAVAPATVVAGSAMFPRDRVIGSLAKYKISFDEADSTEALRDKLAKYYAERTLTKRPILPDDQAAAILFLLGDQSQCTTGQILAVDGGLPEAFLR
jgi:rhamnulose-1-phosphate aldolase/alcohol dehydrogenase